MKTIIGEKTGFTIIETMISISLFLVVVMVGMDSLLNANVVHHKTADMRSIMDNLNFVMEDMSRNMRTGYNFKCFRRGIDIVINYANVSSLPVTRSCADGWAIAFEPADGDPADYNDQWAYYINDTVLPPGYEIWKSTDGANTFVQLTPNEVVLDSFSGYSVLGAEPESAGNDQQPFVIIRLSGRMTYKNVVTPFSLQTAVSQRLLDIGN